MIVGGIDKNVGNFSHFILDNLGALNPDNPSNPTSACRPFDINRNGTV
jgi:3-oxoacyl-(acyl-carrier-protein) synthase